jgi:transposase
MPMLAEVIDAVVGADTHRDTHEIEIAQPTGAVIAVCQVSNDTRGHAQVVGWIGEHTPGPRVVVAVEGTRSYGAGLARALAEAGLTVIECEQPTRAARRGKGKSDAIDAHLAVLSALRLDADRLPAPRADGDREALRILLTAREELTTAGTGQTNRLKALLRDGDDTDRTLARGKLADRTLNQAIHTIAKIRMRDCPRTRAYVARRTAEGKRKPEIRRCLKRYIARELYRGMTAVMTTSAV